MRVKPAVFTRSNRTVKNLTYAMFLEFRVVNSVVLSCHFFRPNQSSGVSPYPDYEPQAGVCICQQRAELYCWSVPLASCHGNAQIFGSEREQQS